MHISVLGAGMVGRAIAADLSRRHTVTAYDLQESHLATLRICHPEVKWIQADLSEFHLYKTLLASAEIVVLALPGFMGYQALKTVIELEHSVVDISFFPEDPSPLHTLAVDKGVRVVTDCGVAPGMSNLMLGYASTRMKVNAFHAMVGGLPLHPQAPFYYKAPFSPVDVLEEYTRPARLRINGADVTRPALSDVETVYISGAGMLEAFNTDGLRSLLHSFPDIPDMAEKTLRYPGHAALMQLLLSSGLLNKKPVPFEGKFIRPLDFNGQLLMEQWKLLPDEEEFTVMRVLATGVKEGEPCRIQWDLLDRYDAATGTSSMARSTGYTCTAMVEYLKAHPLPGPGLWLPERVGTLPGALSFITDFLAGQSVRWCCTEG